MNMSEIPVKLTAWADDSAEAPLTFEDAALFPSGAVGLSVKVSGISDEIRLTWTQIDGTPITWTLTVLPRVDSVAFSGRMNFLVESEPKGIIKLKWLNWWHCWRPQWWYQSWQHVKVRRYLVKSLGESGYSLLGVRSYLREVIWVGLWGGFVSGVVGALTYRWLECTFP